MMIRMAEKQFMALLKQAGAKFVDCGSVKGVRKPGKRAPVKRVKSAKTLEAERDWILDMKQGPGLFIPLQLVSEQNQREHWAVKNRRKKQQQTAVTNAYIAAPYNVSVPPVGRVLVMMTRYGPKVYDDDGNVASLKHVRDAVAKWLGVDDGDTGKVAWICRQDASRFYGVRIEFVAARKQE